MSNVVTCWARCCRSLHSSTSPDVECTCHHIQACVAWMYLSHSTYVVLSVVCIYRRNMSLSPFIEKLKISRCGPKKDPLYVFTVFTVYRLTAEQFILMFAFKSVWIKFVDTYSEFSKIIRLLLVKKLVVMDDYVCFFLKLICRGNNFIFKISNFKYFWMTESCFFTWTYIFVDFHIIRTPS